MTFHEYLNEIENYSTRGERLESDCQAGMTYAMAMEWLRAAYKVGYQAGKESRDYEA